MNGDVDWDSLPSRETAVNIMASAWRSCIKPIVESNCVQYGDGGWRRWSEGSTPEKALGLQERCVPKGVILTGMLARRW